MGVSDVEPLPPPLQGHDLSYSKQGSFFCDCGAKEDGSCKVSLRPNMDWVEIDISSL